LPVIEDLQSRLTSNGAVMVVAHRGCWRLAPENSVRAIEECIRIGVDMVEIDIRRTADGQLVAMHDETVDRTTNGSGAVSEFTLNELRRLRLRAGPGGSDAPLADQPIPTLEEVLAVARQGILVNLDVKSALRDASFELARKMGLEDRILIKMTLTSPQDAALSDAAFLGKTFFMPIIREDNGALAQQISSLEPLDPVAFEVIYRTEPQLAQACEAAARQQARCWVNTMWDSLSPGHSDDLSVLAPDEHWGYLIGLGVNMIQTDRPEDLIRYLESKGFR
jgi:glycerophosphoryl diester phosphodiesterase